MTDYDWAYRLMRCNCNGGRAADAPPATGLEPAWRQTWRPIQTALSGTDGAGGDLTISANSGDVYIENRTGGTRQVMALGVAA